MMVMEMNSTQYSLNQVKTNFTTQTSSAPDQKFRKISKEESVFVDLLSIIMDKKHQGIALFWDKNEKRFCYWIEGIGEKELSVLYDFLKNKLEVKKE